MPTLADPKKTRPATKRRRASKRKINDDDRADRAEQAQLAGMAGGCEAYNSVMGWDLE